MDNAASTKALNRALNDRVAIDDFAAGSVIRWTHMDHYIYAAVKASNGRWYITGTANVFGGHDFDFLGLLGILTRSTTSDVVVATDFVAVGNGDEMLDEEDEDDNSEDEAGEYLARFAFAPGITMQSYHDLAALLDSDGPWSKQMVFQFTSESPSIFNTLFGGRYQTGFGRTAGMPGRLDTSYLDSFSLADVTAEGVVAADKERAASKNNPQNVAIYNEARDIVKAKEHDDFVERTEDAAYNRAINLGFNSQEAKRFGRAVRWAMLANKHVDDLTVDQFNALSARLYAAREASKA